MIMHPENISIRDFTYYLPEDRIASYPLAERDASRLLIYQDGNITEDIYRNIALHLPKNSLLVFNNTRVVEARILFKKTTGAIVEIFCLEPHEQYPDITTALSQKGKIFWKCLVGRASKWKHGQLLEKKINYNKATLVLQARFIEKKSDYFVIEFSWSPGELSFAEVLHHAGLVPLPPYIKRKVEEADTERYQTIYARYNGSVAAPTAGLHFTDRVFEELSSKNILYDFVTLHTGAGTFKPVKSETLQHHEMHEEFIEVFGKTIKNLIDNIGKQIIPVGTTSLRTIESLFWLGAKIILQPGIQQHDLVLHQWESYELKTEHISAKESLYALLQWMMEKQLDKLITKTRLLIAPTYEFKITRSLITNFHQSQSTLLLLVAALVGEDWKTVYNYALNKNFRFLSYGDGMLIV
jgi:S-adenosylmethionine:tRNA ribosyltransferase-isomerase